MRALAISLSALAMFAAGCDRSATAQKEPPQPAASSESGAVAASDGEEVMDSCPGEESSCGSMKAASNDQSEFGTFSLAASEQPLSTVAANIESGKKTVKVSGTVDSVCKKKGCWMVLRDGDVTARVFTHAGGFFLPVSTAKGRSAVVEGELEAKTMSEKFAKHLAEDQGRDPSSVEGATKELVINATAVALR